MHCALQWHCRKISPVQRCWFFLWLMLLPLPAQATPQGYYNIERMVKPVVSRGGQVRLCGACCEARGIRAIPLLEGAEISTMSQLAQWTVESARVLVF